MRVAFLSSTRARRCFAVVWTAMSLAAPAHSHELWLLPEQFEVEPGASTRLFLSVGEQFVGERVGLARTGVAALRRHSKGRSTDLHSLLPSSGTAADVRVQLPQAGWHLFALDSEPSEIVLGADKFHAYLRDEGLETIVAQRTAAGLALAPARERYRRNVKTLVQAGPAADAGWASITGQRLELVLLANPYQLGPGAPLGVQILFDGRPLAAALIKCWYRSEGRTQVLLARSDSDGRVSVRLPQAGVWMVSAVHMIAAIDSPAYDWDSFWANLSFRLPAAPTVAARP